ncbi:AAA family ATPase (plasmid) [Peteryoungia desertarenae]|uniref:AAA family ATPase n=1 Tax=Peteryoungia desertarenae TaxID=1813451 RepID=A0ABX6QTG4_9HYPH|nr:AAA family ATPase [Peteryoungia desertarenae]QLF71774.1 AAA family ATPase [Peteryoungia desertarenae]
MPRPNRRDLPFLILSGCSGGGKSTLLVELARRGHRTVPEPGQRSVAEEMAGDGAALPWIDIAAFALKAIELTAADLEAAASATCWVVFDRSLVDAVSALNHLGLSEQTTGLLEANRYHSRVFLTPPWRDIFAVTDERRHSFEEAVAEYHRLILTYEDAGYELTMLPRVDVGQRADLIEEYMAQKV